VFHIIDGHHGGFEAVRGFHREFNAWKRRPSVRKCGTTIAEEFSAPCIGEYTHIRPKEDDDVFRRAATKLRCLLSVS
jgi:hypothetical protein